MEQLDKMFGVTEAGSDVATELRAGGATFLDNGLHPTSESVNAVRDRHPV